MTAAPRLVVSLLWAVIAVVAIQSRIAWAGRPQYEAHDGPRIQFVAKLGMKKARTIAFAGKYAFVGQNLDGTELIDISTPARPRRLAHFPPEFMAPLDLKVIDNRRLLLVADRFKGLVIWNIRKPEAPIQVSALKVPGIATHVDVSNIGRSRVAAVACAGDGLVTINITRPKTPRQIGQFTTRIDYSRRVTLDGNIAYLADHFDGGLKVLQLKETTAPAALFQVSMRGFCESLSLSKNLLAVCYRNYGVRLFHVKRSGRQDEQSTPSLTFLCNLVRLRSEVRDLQLLAHQRMVVANDAGGLELYDVSNPQLPILLDEYEFDDPAAAAQSVQEHDGNLYVPAWDGGVTIFRLTDGG